MIKVGHAESDRSSHDDFSIVLKEYAITPPMSDKGKCWEIACLKKLPGLLKGEWLQPQWPETIRQAKEVSIARLLWDNQTCMRSTPCSARSLDNLNRDNGSNKYMWIVTGA